MTDQFKWNDGSGGLFKNKKLKNSQPDMKGECTINGTVYEIAGWYRDGARGQYVGLKIQVKRDRAEQKADVPKVEKNDDGLPF